MMSAILVFGVSHAWAAPIEGLQNARIECPPILKVQKPIGWTVVEKEPAHPLEDIVIYAGEPFYGAKVPPNDIRTNSNLVMTRWMFPEVVEGGLWAACQDHGTPVMLAIPLKSSYRTCDARYDIHVYGQHTVRWMRCHSE